MIQTSVASDTTDTNHTSIYRVRRAGGVPFGARECGSCEVFWPTGQREPKVGKMMNIRMAMMIGLSCSAILVLVRMGTAVAMPGLGL